MARDGCYLLRAHLPEKDFPPQDQRQAPALWSWYMQLVQVEEAFKTLKSDLGLRPIHHQVQTRVEAHIFVAFLGYCLTVTLRMKLRGARPGGSESAVAADGIESPTAPGLTPREALAALSGIQMVDVLIPTTDGRELVLPRYTEPNADQALLLQTLNLTLPAQPPPRIRAGQIDLPAAAPPP